MTCHFVCHLVCGSEETKSPCRSCTGKKKPKMEKINDAWKDYFKTWGQ